ncbi:hypothetical protein [Kitasatospora sp. NPDC087315]|uniref:hypothetical protein n=1 Tax=Kitasatospora sp. NPDC087315 TaxID=3364069 RepID=UPI0038234F08
MGVSALAGLRRAAGYTQETFVVAFAALAAQLGVQAAVSVRQLRRWEAPDPPLPHPGQQEVLEALLGVPLEELGFQMPVERRSTHRPGGHHGGVKRRRFVVDIGAVLGAAAPPAARPGRRGRRTNLAVAGDRRRRPRREMVRARNHPGPRHQTRPDGGAGPGEIAAIEIYSGLPTAPAVGHGATIDFHDGSRTFINHVR